MRETNLIFLHKPKDGEILLAMKKRRFGADKWNGVGGKVDEGESIKQSAIREIKEEICVDVEESALKGMGVMDFFFENKDDWNQRVHIFLIESWQGEPCETEEMMPKWFKISDIPYDKMWVDDPLWLPRVLKGEHIEASFTLSEDGAKMIKHSIN